MIRSGITAAALTLSAIFLAGMSAAADHSASVINLVALDVVSQGNTATTLGNLDGCVRVEVGSTAVVDLVVDAVPQDRPVIAFQVDVKYNPALLQVTAVNNDLLLAAVGSYSGFGGLTDALPDSDGSFRTSLLDTESRTAPEANVERGPGVLSRITFRAKANGSSPLTIGVDAATGDYPALQDTRNETINVSSIGAASIFIGQDCTAAAQQPQIAGIPPIEELFTPAPQVTLTPAPGTGSPGPSGETSASPTDGQTQQTTPTPTITEADGGTSTGAVIAVVVLAGLGACALGGGGWLLYRRSQREEA